MSELEREVASYRDALGFRFVTRDPAVGAAFPRAPVGENHHDLGSLSREAWTSEDGVVQPLDSPPRWRWRDVISRV